MTPAQAARAAREAFGRVGFTSSKKHRRPKEPMTHPLQNSYLDLFRVHLLPILPYQCGVPPTSFSQLRNKPGKHTNLEHAALHCELPVARFGSRKGGRVGFSMYSNLVCRWVLELLPSHTYRRTF